MKHLCVYTTPEILKHKQSSVSCYWEFANRPKILDVVDEKWAKDDFVELRFYFAVSGFIVGYFQIDDMSHSEVDFDGYSWIEIDPIPQKSFQGFKYVNGI